MSELPAAMEVLGLHPPRLTVVVIGGAAGLEEARTDELPFFRRAEVIHADGEVVEFRFNV